MQSLKIIAIWIIAGLITYVAAYFIVDYFNLNKTIYSDLIGAAFGYSGGIIAILIIDKID
jgi:hypothetical protein